MDDLLAMLDHRHHQDEAWSISRAFTGNFELAADGSFQVCQEGRYITTRKTDSTSIRAEISSIPDVSAIPLDQPWEIRTPVGFATAEIKDLPSSADSLLGTGEWVGLGSGATHAFFPWRLEPVSLDDINWELDLLGKGKRPVTKKIETERIRSENLKRLESWVEGADQSIAESRDSMPSLTDGSTRDTDSICPSDRPTRHMDNFEDLVIDAIPGAFLIDLTHWGDPTQFMAVGTKDNDSGQQGDEATSQSEDPPFSTSSSGTRGRTGAGVPDHTPGSSDGDPSESESGWLSDYTEAIPRIGNDHPLFPIKEEVVQKVLAVLESRSLTNKQGNTHESPSSSNSRDGDSTKTKATESTSSNRQNARQSSIKRDRDTSGNDEPGDEDGDRHPRTNGIERQKDRWTVKDFWPVHLPRKILKYRGCYKYVMKRMTDVKQHLSRIHLLPIYCPRCKIIFDSEDGRDQHASAVAVCPARDDIKHDGVTQTQKKLVSQRLSPRMPLEEQWYTIFRILFPNHRPEPDSPYIDKGMTEEMEFVLDTISAEGPGIVHSYLTTRGIKLATVQGDSEERNLDDVLQAAIADLLQNIARKWTESSLQTSGSVDCAIRDGAAASDSSRLHTNSERSNNSSDTLVEERSANSWLPATLDSIQEEGSHPGEITLPNTQQFVGDRQDRTLAPRYMSPSLPPGFTPDGQLFSGNVSQDEAPQNGAEHWTQEQDSGFAPQGGEVMSPPGIYHTGQSTDDMSFSNQVGDDLADFREFYGAE